MAHKPKAAGWTIVHNEDDLVLLRTMCECGDEDCSWGVDIYPITRQTSEVFYYGKQQDVDNG